MAPGGGKSRKGLSHLDRSGRATMVNVSRKNDTVRHARASATVRMKSGTLQLIEDQALPKGDVFAAARIAGILAAKNTASLIPLCHPLPISSVTLEFTIDRPRSSVTILSSVTVTGKTGVEMEALTAVTVAALTLYDMCKSADKEMVISDVFLLEKKGGKSGNFRHPSAM